MADDKQNKFKEMGSKTSEDIKKENNNQSIWTWILIQLGLINEDNLDDKGLIKEADRKKIADTGEFKEKYRNFTGKDYSESKAIENIKEIVKKRAEFNKVAEEAANCITDDENFEKKLEELKEKILNDDSIKSDEEKLKTYDAYRKAIQVKANNNDISIDKALTMTTLYKPKNKIFGYEAVNEKRKGEMIKLMDEAQPYCGKPEDFAENLKNKLSRYNGLTRGQRDDLNMVGSALAMEYKHLYENFKDKDEKGRTPNKLEQIELTEKAYLNVLRGEVHYKNGKKINDESKKNLEEAVKRFGTGGKFEKLRANMAAHNEQYREAYKTYVGLSDEGAKFSVKNIIENSKEDFKNKNLNEDLFNSFNEYKNNKEKLSNEDNKKLNKVSLSEKQRFWSAGNKVKGSAEAAKTNNHRLFLSNSQIMKSLKNLGASDKEPKDFKEAAKTVVNSQKKGQYKGI